GRRRDDRERERREDQDRALHRGTRDMSNKMWGGRFETGPAEIMEEINASIDFDRELPPQDVAGSLAHAAMLAKTGIVETADAEAIARGLTQVKGEIEAGNFR